MKIPTTADDEGINMTPIIDIVFNLLIFFLVASEIQSQEEKEMRSPLDLPVAAKAEPITSKKEIVVNVTKEGKYIVREKEHSERQLSAFLTQAQKNNPDQEVKIRADGQTFWKSGVVVMGLCNQAGIKSYRVVALTDEKR